MQRYVNACKLHTAEKDDWISPEESKECVFLRAVLCWINGMWCDVMWCDVMWCGGGEKYMCQGIFFKFASDDNQITTALYGATEYANKAAGT